MSEKAYKGSSERLIKGSNFRKKMAVVKQVQKGLLCKVHPNSYWGKSGMDKYWLRCTEGHKKNEDCEKKIVAV